MTLQITEDGEYRVISDGDIDVRIDYVRADAAIWFRIVDAYSDDWRPTGLQTAELPRRGDAADWQYVAEQCDLLES